MGGSRDMPSSSWSMLGLLVERREKHLSRDWLFEVAAQVENVSKQLTDFVHCHQRKVLHLDVKPANVLVTSKGIDGQK